MDGRGTRIDINRLMSGFGRLKKKPTTQQSMHIVYACERVWKVLEFYNFRVFMQYGDGRCCLFLTLIEAACRWQSIARG